MAILTLVALLLPPGYAGEQMALSCSNHFSEARNFLRAIYPELQGEGLAVRYTVSDILDSSVVPEVNQFSVSVTRTQLAPRIQSSASENSPSTDLVGAHDVHLSATFTFDNDGQVVLFSANSRWPGNSEKNEVFRKLIESHPEWPDKKIIELMKAEGAKFGPDEKEALRKELPIEQLQPFLGSLTLKSLQFELRNDQSENARAFLSWHVEMQGLTPSGKASSYYMLAEPFNGRINLVRRRPK
jgi:hypothetical protein